MGAALVPVVLVLIVLVVLGVGIAQFGKRQERRRSQLVADHTTLAYELPDGQDPAVVVAALSEKGYAASIDENARVLIGSHDEETTPDREEVRRVLASARRLNFEGDIAQLPAPRFVDE